MFQKPAKTTTNAGKSPANVPNTSQNARADCDALAYETRVGSPPDFQLKRVPAPSCLRALRFKRFGRSSRKRRSFSGKCSKKRPKQQQTPEKKLPQMFQKPAKTTTNTGVFPANVPKKGQNNNKRRRKISGECSTKNRTKTRRRKKIRPLRYYRCQRCYRWQKYRTPADPQNQLPQYSLRKQQHPR